MRATVRENDRSRRPSPIYKRGGVQSNLVAAADALIEPA